MVKRFFLLMIMLEAFTIKAQNDVYVRKGLLSATATYSPGFMLKTSANTVYVHGFFDYFIENKISLRGEAYYFLGELTNGKKLFNQNHTIGLIPIYHFGKNNFDAFFGAGPEMNITQVNYTFDKVSNKQIDYRSKLKPEVVFTPTIGVTYFVNRFFNFFASAKYIIGHHVSDGYGAVSLQEIRISAGLGFNYNLLKEKK